MPCSRSSGNGEALEHSLLCLHLSEMFFPPADPSFSQNKPCSGVKSSPFPQSRLIYSLHLAAAFQWQLSEVPKHNLVVSVVLHLCWTDALVATRCCMLFSRERYRDNGQFCCIFLKFFLKQNKTHKNKIPKPVRSRSEIKKKRSVNMAKRVVILLKVVSYDLLPFTKLLVCVAQTLGPAGLE